MLTLPKRCVEHELLEALENSCLELCAIAMPEVVEYRIPFPSTVDEYLVGMMYMIARASSEEDRRSGGNKAVDLIRHERFTENEHGLECGIYTEKVFHIRRFLPRFLRPLVPAESAKVVEKSWASYPNRCLTLYFCPYLGPSSFLSIESRYLADRGDTYNALNLRAEELGSREVVMLDIASEEKLGMSTDVDIRSFRPKTVDREVLAAGVWSRKHDPVMCCYKVCRLNVSTPRVKAFCQRYLQSSFIRYNRQAYVWMDSWRGLGLSDIPGALPGEPEATQVLFATELSADLPILGLGAARDLFDSSDQTNPFT